jgi:hypothetical protein
MSMDGNRMRAVVLQVLSEQAAYSKLETYPILTTAAQRLGMSSSDPVQVHVLLTIWHDLFRTGVLAWGWDFQQSAPPLCHLTERGRQMLTHLSRDPDNPQGYLRYLQSQAMINPVAESYLKEALETYTNACYKATAVMVGAAAESLGLEVREALVAQLTAQAKPVPRNLNDWRIKTILDAIEAVLHPHQRAMGNLLGETFSSYWPAFTGQFRMARNDAGHPHSIDPVSQSTVHAALLLFPELAKLTRDLIAWIQNYTLF